MLTLDLRESLSKHVRKAVKHHTYHKEDPKHLKIGSISENECEITDKTERQTENHLMRINAPHPIHTSAVYKVCMSILTQEEVWGFILSRGLLTERVKASTQTFHN